LSVVPLPPYFHAMVGTCPFGLALCCPGSSFLVSSLLSFNIIRLPFRCFWTLMAMVCSHIYRIALRRSSCYESGWSLVTAAAMPHGDYLNRMAHTRVCCVHIYTYIHMHIYIYTLMWSAMLRALRLLLLYRHEQSPGNIIYTAGTATVTVPYSSIPARSLHAAGLLCSSCQLVWHRFNRRPGVSRPAHYQQRDFVFIGLWPLGFRAFGPVGFWVYGRWDFGPLASETGFLKFQRVRSSPKPNNAMSPFITITITSAVHRRPKAVGLWPSDCGQTVGFGCWSSVLGRLPL
jgi:hypothetical protein